VDFSFILESPPSSSRTEIDFSLNVKFPNELNGTGYVARESNKMHINIRENEPKRGWKAYISARTWEIFLNDIHRRFIDAHWQSKTCRNIHKLQQLLIKFMKLK